MEALPTTLNTTTKTQWTVSILYVGISTRAHPFLVIQAGSSVMSLSHPSPGSDTHFGRCCGCCCSRGRAFSCGGSGGSRSRDSSRDVWTIGSRWISWLELFSHAAPQDLSFTAYAKQLKEKRERLSNTKQASS